MVTPGRRYGIPKTDVERIMSHYGVSEEEACRMIEEKGATALLPDRGTGLQQAVGQTTQTGSMGLWVVIGGALGTIVGSLIGYAIARRKAA